MALARTWKMIWAEDEDASVARMLYQRITERFSGQPARGAPVCCKLVEDTPELFVAITNCGWSWLDLDAWKLGHPGVHRYISATADWDEDDLAWYTAGAEQISAGQPSDVAEGRE